MTTPTATTHTRLNQIIAIRAGVQNDTHQLKTRLHHVVQKPAVLAGISRTYQPRFEDGVIFPAEQTKVQVKSQEVLRQLAEGLARLFDVNAAMDYTNTVAKADIVVGEQVLLRDVPTTYMMFLEKQLTDVETFIAKLPVLDPSEDWEYDPAADVMATKPTTTTKTSKTPRNHVLAEATDRHPAQVTVWHEDVVIGFWKTVKFSGALEQRQINELLGRVRKLRAAVKFAREQANMTPVVDPKPGGLLMAYLFDTPMS